MLEKKRVTALAVSVLSVSEAFTILMFSQQPIFFGCPHLVLPALPGSVLVVAGGV